jgi:hypothetical protein
MSIGVFLFHSFRMFKQLIGMTVLAVRGSHCGMFQSLRRMMFSCI